MNKKELIVTVSKETGFTQKDVTAVIDAAIDTIVATVAAGEDVKLSGLGTFSVAERGERVGRNPQTGETMTIEASKSPKFKAASAFKAAVKEA